MDKVSIIIATFNSEETLPLVLKSIVKQTYPKNKIEILLVDGGSTDKTFEIAEQFNCRVINNPRTEPVFGKYLAYLNAQGKYAIYLDHDEVLENKKSITLKISAFKSSNKVKAVIGNGYQSPKGYPFINNYINEFGDPFSFFIYRLSKNEDFFTNTMKKHYSVVLENQSFTIYDFSKVKSFPLIELVAGGSMLDILYFKKEFPQTLKRFELIPHLFYIMLSKNPYIAVTKNDILTHYSADTYKKYFNKIKWRIKNNIYHASDIGISGFSGREKFQSKFLRFKKYLFIPYAYSIILPLMDTLILIISRKKLIYFLHLPLIIYTANLIIYHSFLKKILGIKLKLKSYDESKEIDSI